MEPPPDALVGRRVVVRRRIVSPTHRFSDVVGRLEAAGAALVVRTDDGRAVVVPAGDVHRVKAVPPGAADIMDLERIAASGWPAPETAWLGGWLLRAGGGWTGRANSALPLGDPGLPVADAVASVRAWYDARALPAQFAVPLPAAAPLDHVLAREGFAPRRTTDVLTVALPAGSRAAVPTGLRLEHAARPDQRWLAAAYGDPAALPALATDILAGAECPVFTVLLAGAEVVALARAVVDEGWLGVTELSVSPSHRRRGLASALLGWLHRWGTDNGAHAAYLQVLADNAPAHALYRRLGYDRHHRYRYRIAHG